MMRITGMNHRSGAALAASWLHALLLLVSLVALPANAPAAFADTLTSIGISDAGEPDVSDDLAFGGEFCVGSAFFRPDTELNASRGLFVRGPAPRLERSVLGFEARGPPPARV
jgi:hypothetical protein